MGGVSIAAQEPADGDLEGRIESLENTLQQVLIELQGLKQERDLQRAKAEAAEARGEQLESQQQAMLEELDAMRTAAPRAGGGGGEGGGDGATAGPPPSVSALPAGLRLGGYGEHHFNFVEGSGGDIGDIHRFVAYVGYEFAEWLHLNTETELEHAFVQDNDGEISLEQFFVDVNMHRAVNLRLGRALHPAGIVNRYHEPTTFYGVERPTYSSIVLPSTWSIDGIGFWGSVTDWLSYEVYAHAGLDGSNFSAGSGIRGGRIKERPNLSDPGVSGRIDLRPLSAIDALADLPLDWRTGVSYSWIGTENGDQAANAGKPDGSVEIVALDTDLRWSRFEWRAEAAWIDNRAAGRAGSPAGVADSVFGAYGQVAYHFWPDAWRNGRLSEMDTVAFVRYGYSDPQHGDVPGGARDRTRTRRETTVGVSVYPVPNLVFKMDYTFADSVAGPAPNRFDVGFGYDF